MSKTPAPDQGQPFLAVRLRMDATLPLFGPVHWGDVEDYSDDMGVPIFRVLCDAQAQADMKAQDHGFLPLAEPQEGKAVVDCLMCRRLAKMLDEQAQSLGAPNSR